MHTLHLKFQSALCLFPSSDANYPPCITYIAYIGKFGNGTERRFTFGRIYYSYSHLMCGVYKTYKHARPSGV
jgi:hypothetical protein